MKLCRVSCVTVSALKKLVFITFPMVVATVQAQVFDKYSAEVGTGKHAMIYKLGAGQQIGNGYSFLARNNLHPYWEINLAKIIGRRYQNTLGRSQSLTMVGITPVLRWQSSQGIFAEVGIGANYMSDTYDNAGQVAGSKFQFGDHIGIGYQFSDSLEVTAKYQHYSNAGFTQPNPAINFTTVKVAYSF